MGPPPSQPLGFRTNPLVSIHCSKWSPDSVSCLLEGGEGSATANSHLAARKPSSQHVGVIRASHGAIVAPRRVTHLAFEKVKLGRSICILGGDITLDKVMALS